MTNYEKIKNIVFKRHCPTKSQEILLKWYEGIAYFDPLRFEYCTSLIPLNLLIRYSIKFYQWIKMGR